MIYIWYIDARYEMNTVQCYHIYQICNTFSASKWKKCLPIQANQYNMITFKLNANLCKCRGRRAQKVTMMQALEATVEVKMSNNEYSINLKVSFEQQL